MYVVCTSKPPAGPCTQAGTCSNPTRTRIRRKDLDSGTNRYVEIHFSANHSGWRRFGRTVCFWGRDYHCEGEIGERGEAWPSRQLIAALSNGTSYRRIDNQNKTFLIYYHVTRARRLRSWPATCLGRLCGCLPIVGDGCRPRACPTSCHRCMPGALLRGESLLIWPLRSTAQRQRYDSSSFPVEISRLIRLHFADGQIIQTLRVANRFRLHDSRYSL